MNGLRTVQTEKGKYRIVHETGATLPFVLQGPKEAADMKYALAHLMIVQETCQELKKLQDSCKAYTDVSSMDSSIADLRMNDSSLMPGKGFKFTDSMLLSSEKLGDILRGPKHKNPLKDGTYTFVEGISTFLNNVQTARIQSAKNKANQVAQK